MRHSPRSLVLLLLLTLVACGEDASPGSVEVPASPPPTWRAEVVFQAPDKLGGCAIGDVDPTRPGLEIAAVSRNGDVWVLGREGDAWTAERVGTTPGEMIQCAIGDARLDRPGDELVVAGMASGGEEDGGRGEARLFWREADGWKQEPVFQDTALIHGVAIADMAPERDGNQIVTVGFSQNAVVLDRSPDKGWLPIHTASLGSPGKTAIPFDFGVAVACAGDGEARPLRRRGLDRTRPLARYGGCGAPRVRGKRSPRGLRRREAAPDRRRGRRGRTVGDLR